jgi:iron complex transport system permease protein
MMADNQVEKTFAKRSSKWKLILTALVLILFLTIIVSLNIGFAPISFGEILNIIGKNVPFISGAIDPSSVSPTKEAIIMQIRLPRVLAGALVGAGLAAAGVVYQGIFRNPMADSYVLGASAGASVGYSLSVLYLTTTATLVGLGTAEIVAFAFAVTTVFLVYFMSRVGNKVPTTTLLLSGIVVNIFLLSMVTVMELNAGDKLQGIVAWISGAGFSNAVWTQVWMVFPIVLAGTVLIYFFTRDLNMLAMGDDTAQHLGVNTETVRRILLAVASLITAAGVCISGVIGFVGLIIPHMTRILIGPDHRILLPTSIIVGAIFLVMCDAVARVATGASELPVGVITAIVGTPFFIYLLRKRKTSYSL